MIRNNSISAVLPLAQKLSDNGIVLSAIQGTPLSCLVQKSYTPLIDSKDFYAGGDTSLRIWSISDCLKQPNAQGFSEHCEAIDDIRKVLVTAVGSHLSYARNVVVPQINEVVEKVHKAQEEADIRIGSMLSIVQDEWDPIWENPVLETMIENVKFTALNPDTLIPRVHPLLTEQQLRDYLNTGADRFDKEIQSWIDNIGVKFLVDTYRWYFVQSALTGQDWHDYDQKVNWLLGTDPWSRKQSIIIYLLTKGLRANIPEGVDMDEISYQEAMALVQAQAGRIVSRCIERRQFLKDTKSLVLDWPMRGRDHLTEDAQLSQILVNTDVYNKWLEDGGKPEILFGSAVTDRETKYDVLLEKANDYYTAWKRHEAIIRTGQRSQLFNIVRDAIMMAVGELVAAIPVEEMEGRDRNKMHAVLREKTFNVNIDNISDIYDICCDMVCNVVHCHTNAYTILTTMKDVSDQNPELPATEVTTIAAINILCKWFADQCSIKQV